MIHSEREDDTRQSDQRRSTRASRYQTRGREGDRDGGDSSSSGASEHSDENESVASPRDSKSNRGSRRSARSGARSHDPIEASDEEDEKDEEKQSDSSGSDEDEQGENQEDEDGEQGRYRTRTSARHKTSTPSHQDEMNKLKGSSHVKKEPGRKREFELPLWAREGLVLLNGIMATKHALEYFNEPVDVEELQLTDYYEIIKHPMDLGTVSDKLQKGDYSDLEELFSDMRLTFNNAIAYNPAKLPVHKAAVDLLNRFNKKAKRLEMDLMAGKNEVDLCIEEHSDDQSNTRLTRRSSRLQHPRHQPRCEPENSRPPRGREEDRRQREVGRQEDRRKEEMRRDRDKRAAQRRRLVEGDGGSSESGTDKSGYMETEYRNRLRARESRSNVDRFNPNERSSSRGAASSASAYVRDNLRSFDRRRSSVAQKVPIKKNRRSTVVTENGRKFRVAETSASESGENVPQRSSAPHTRRGGGGRAEDDNSDSDAGPQGGHYMSGGKQASSSSMPMPINADLNPLEIDSSVTFESIGGLDDHIRSLKESVFLPLTYPDVFSQLSVEAPRGVLFHGPPGTGKTMMARALANSCSLGSKKISFFMRKGADCLRLAACMCYRTYSILCVDVHASLTHTRKLYVMRHTYKE